MKITDAKSRDQRDEMLAEFNGRLSTLTGGRLIATYNPTAGGNLLVHIYDAPDGKPGSASSHFDNFRADTTPETIAVALRYYDLGHAEGEANIRRRFNSLMGT